MQIPQWLAGLTGANAHALNFSNDFQPTMGDALQGIGSSMKNHYLQNQGQGQPSGQSIQSVLSGLGGGVPPQGSEPTPALTPAPAVNPRQIQGSPLAPVGNWTGPFDPRASQGQGQGQGQPQTFASILRGLGL